MRRSRTRPPSLAIAVAFVVPSLLAAASAQELPLRELRRYGWGTPGASCGAANAAGPPAAVVQHRQDGAGHELRIHDTQRRQEVQRLPLADLPIAVRFRNDGEVEVRLRATQAFLSLSHWYRLRLTDGAIVGERTLDRLADDDPVARAQLRGERAPGAAPCLHRDGRGTLWWHHGARSYVVADGPAHDLALTPDGRFVVLWLPSGLTVVPVAPGDARPLPLPGDTIRAIAPGAAGDELSVVTATDVHVFRATTAKEVRAVPHAVKAVRTVAATPDGLCLALASGAERSSPEVSLLDLGSGRTTTLDARAWALAWSPDGQHLVCVTAEGLVTFSRAGELLAERTVAERGWNHLQAMAVLEARSGPTSGYGASPWQLVVTETRLGLAHFDTTSFMPREQPASDGDVPTDRVAYRLRSHFGSQQWIATTRNTFVLHDEARRSTLGTMQLTGHVGLVVTAPAARRVSAPGDQQLIVCERAPR